MALAMQSKILIDTFSDLVLHKLCQVHIISAVNQTKYMYMNYTKPLRSPLESAIKEKINQSKAVTPKEYCEKWVPQKTGYQPKKRGYISACVRELASVLGYAEITIRKWGKDFEGHPDIVKVTLSKQDQLNAIGEILEPRRKNII